MPQNQPQKTLEIFRAGTHQPMGGGAIAFSESDIEAAAAAYNPELSEAPIVVGHPKTNSPAFGWIKSLSKSGRSLEAEPHQVNPDFAEMVKLGAFKKISSSFYLPDSPNNPVPGIYYLRHVGFLGAVPPAVKGMRDAQFASDESECMTVEFGAYETETIADVFRNLREWLIESQSTDVADRIVPNYAIDNLVAEAQRERAKDIAEARQESNKPAIAGFSEPSQTGGTAMAEIDDALKAREDAIQAAQAKLDADAVAFAEQQSAIAAREAELKAREEKIRDAEEAARARELTEFADGLVKEGRLLPRDKAGAVSFMAALDAGTEISFSDGDDTKKQSPLAWFKAFASRMPPQVDFGEFAVGITDEPVVQFAAPSDASVSHDGLSLHNKALAYQKQHPGTTYLDAAIAVGG